MLNEIRIDDYESWIAKAVPYANTEIYFARNTEKNTTPVYLSHYSDGLRTGWSEFDFWEGYDFSVLHSAQTDLGACAASC
jgi:hypothetical protein